MAPMAALDVVLRLEAFRAAEDYEGFASMLTEDVEWVTPIGTWRGKEAVIKFVTSRNSSDTVVEITPLKEVEPLRCKRTVQVKVAGFINKNMYEETWVRDGKVAKLHLKLWNTS